MVFKMRAPLLWLVAGMMLVQPAQARLMQSPSAYTPPTVSQVSQLSPKQFQPNTKAEQGLTKRSLLHANQPVTYLLDMSPEMLRLYGQYMMRYRIEMEDPRY